MKRFYYTFPTLLFLLWGCTLEAQFTVEALPQFGEAEIDEIYTGILSLSPDAEEWEDHGNLIFSIVDGPNTGLWEYLYEDDALVLHETFPAITSIAPHYSPWGSKRYIYYGYWGGLGTEVRRYNGEQSRPFMAFEDQMVGMVVTDWLFSGDFVTWGADCKGWQYDNHGDLLDEFNSGSIHGLLHPSSGLQHRVWNTIYGSVNLGTIYKHIPDLNESAVVAAIGTAPNDPATQLYKSKGISVIPEEMNQPEALDITLLATVPVYENDTERLFVCGQFEINDEMETSLIYYDQGLTNWAVYFPMPFLKGEFSVATRIIDGEGNDALVLGGKVDMEGMGYSADYSGIFVANLSGIQPLEDYIGGTFLTAGAEPFEWTTLDFDEENGRLWAIGENVEGKDSEGNTIQTGFVVNVSDDLEGFIAEQATNTLEQFEIDHQLNIAPNPSSGLFRISTTDGGIQSVTVTDMLGQPINTLVVDEQATQLEIDLSNEADGMYLLHMETDAGVLSKKVVKLQQ